MLLLNVTPIKPLELSEVCYPSHSLFSHLREYCFMIEKTIHGHIGPLIGPMETTNPWTNDLAGPTASHMHNMHEAVLSFIRKRPGMTVPSLMCLFPSFKDKKSTQNMSFSRVCVQDLHLMNVDSARLCAPERERESQ